MAPCLGNSCTQLWQASTYFRDCSFVGQRIGYNNHPVPRQWSVTAQEIFFSGVLASQCSTFPIDSGKQRLSSTYLASHLGAASEEFHTARSAYHCQHHHPASQNIVCHHHHLIKASSANRAQQVKMAEPVPAPVIKRWEDIPEDLHAELKALVLAAARCHDPNLVSISEELTRKIAQRVFSCGWNTSMSLRPPTMQKMTLSLGATLVGKFKEVRKLFPDSDIRLLPIPGKLGSSPGLRQVNTMGYTLEPRRPQTAPGKHSALETAPDSQCPKAGQAGIFSTSPRQ